MRQKRKETYNHSQSKLIFSYRYTQGNAKPEDSFIVGTICQGGSHGYGNIRVAEDDHIVSSNHQRHQNGALQASVCCEMFKVGTPSLSPS